MLKFVLLALLPFLALLNEGTSLLFVGTVEKTRSADNGTMEKLIVANGTITIDLKNGSLEKAGGRGKASKPNVVRFDAERDSFFSIVAVNGELRTALPGSMGLIAENPAELPMALNASSDQLVLEKNHWGSPYELAVRDGKSGFTFFNIEGHIYDYDPNQHLLRVENGRLLLANEFAEKLGRPSDSGSMVGQISISATMRAIEITQIDNGEVKSVVMPPIGDPEAGTVPGPDVVVGDLFGLFQAGVTGTQVGLAVGTDSCNFGTVELNWLQSPNNDHPVIPQNLYRMSGGATNSERFEQIGQSGVKHAFTALQQDRCSLGCVSSGTGSRLGSGCSDPYDASLNATPSLGSRAWINPFTGFFPRGDSATPPNSHTGHVHPSGGALHRALTEVADLAPAQNPGATYYAEAQYVTPHEYAHCQANPGQCNMYNNASYRQYTISGGSGTGASPFTFSPAAATVRMKPAISAWTGAVVEEFRPAPDVDGIGTVAYKVTSTSPGVWHYEYAIYNQNIDRAIRSFAVPIGAGAAVNNIGFHAPPQHPGWAADGTVGNTGFSSTPWTPAQSAGALTNILTWSTETFAQNPNANAIRWGTMYNFRFDSDMPPQRVEATIGFFKTGDPINIQVEAPGGPLVNVSVSGRVMSSAGRGVVNARVLMTDANGVTRAFMTNSFGFFRFDNVAPGATYTFGVKAKVYTYAQQVIPVNGNLSNVNFLPEP